MSYAQFTACGISRRQIQRLTYLGEALGLVAVIRTAEGGDCRVRPPNAYRLTYVPEKGKKAPTDEWRSISADRAGVLVGRFRALEQSSRRQVEDEAEQPVEAMA